MSYAQPPVIRNLGILVMHVLLYTDQILQLTTYQNRHTKALENMTTGEQSILKYLFLNPGSLSSEDFLIWACLIEKGSQFLHLNYITVQ